MKSADFSAVVRRNWPKTVAYLVAGAEPCIQIADAETRQVRRRLVPIGFDHLADLEPAGSWFMAVLVCPGDDLAGLVAWAKGREVERVHFYIHADADARLLAPWRDAGMPLLHVADGFDDWRPLHKVLGMDLNVQVYDDHKPP